MVQARVRWPPPSSFSGVPQRQHPPALPVKVASARNSRAFAATAGPFLGRSPAGRCGIVVRSLRRSRQAHGAVLPAALGGARTSRKAAPFECPTKARLAAEHPEHRVASTAHVTADAGPERARSKHDRVATEAGGMDFKPGVAVHMITARPSGGLPGRRPRGLCNPIQRSCRGSRTRYQRA